MIDIIKLSDYRDYNALHYSLFSDMIKNPEYLKPDFKKEITRNMLRGTIVDALLFTPEDLANYYFSKYSKPSDKMGLLYDNFIANGGNLENIDLDLLSRCRDNIGGIFGNYKDNTVADKLKEAGLNYYREIVEAGDKPVVDLNLAYECTKILTSIQTSENPNIIKWISNEALRPASLEEFADYIIKLHNDNLDSIIKQPSEVNILSNNSGFSLFQLPLVLTLDDTTSLKTLIDLVYVENKDNRLVIHIIDLKVTDKPDEFDEKFIKYNYYIQSGLGMYLMEELMKAIGFNCSFRYHYIVASLNRSPKILSLSQDSATILMKPTILSNGELLYSIEELIVDYKRIMKSQVYINPRELDLTNFIPVSILV